MPFIENPWYDDHFDIQKDNHCLGKTFLMVATENDLLGRSYRLVGLSLYEKFDKAVELLEEWTESELTEIVTEEAVS